LLGCRGGAITASILFVMEWLCKKRYTLILSKCFALTNVESVISAKPIFDFNAIKSFKNFQNVFLIDFQDDFLQISILSDIPLVGFELVLHLFQFSVGLRNLVLQVFLVIRHFGSDLCVA